MSTKRKDSLANLGAGAAVAEPEEDSAAEEAGRVAEVRASRKPGKLPTRYIALTHANLMIQLKPEKTHPETATRLEEGIILQFTEIEGGLDVDGSRLRSVGELDLETCEYVTRRVATAQELANMLFDHEQMGKEIVPEEIWLKRKRARDEERRRRAADEAEARALEIAETPEQRKRLYVGA